MFSILCVCTMYMTVVWVSYDRCSEVKTKAKPFLLFPLYNAMSSLTLHGVTKIVASAVWI